MNKEEFEKRMREKMAENRSAFEGKYKTELKALMGLSESDLKAISPDTTSPETYDALITVVKEASSANLAQAELKQRIEKLGSVAVKIAEKVPGLLP